MPKVIGAWVTLRVLCEPFSGVFSKFRMQFVFWMCAIVECFFVLIFVLEEFFLLLSPFRIIFPGLQGANSPKLLALGEGAPLSWWLLLGIVQVNYFLVGELRGVSKPADLHAVFFVVEERVRVQFIVHCIVGGLTIAHSPRKADFSASILWNLTFPPK